MADSSDESEISEKLWMKGIHAINPDIIRTHPKLGDILLKLVEVEESNCAELYAELEDVKNERNAVCQSYFEREIVYQHLFSMATDANEESGESEDEFLNKFIKQNLTAAQLMKNFIECPLQFVGQEFEETGESSSSKPGGHNLLGLTANAFGAKINHNPAMWKMVIGKLTEKIECNVTDLGIAIGGANADDPLSAKLAKSVELLPQIKKCLQEKKQKKEMIGNLTTKHEYYLWCYFSLVKSCTEALLKKMRDKLKAEEMETAQACEYHVTLIQLLGAQLKLIEWELLKKTYDAETVTAMNAIKDELDRKQKILELEEKDKSNILMSYKTIGPEFEKLVEKFADLTQKYDDKKWALIELEKTT